MITQAGFFLSQSETAASGNCFPEGYGDGLAACGQHIAMQAPVILGVVGDSASGKSTLTKGITSFLGADAVTLICTDDYHALSRKERQQRGVSALDPAVNHLDILEDHLRLLKQGRPILKPVYDHKDGALKAPVYVAPTPFIVVEGLLGFLSPALRASFDLKVYLEPQESLRRSWKLQRDVIKRGYDPARVAEIIERRVPLSEAFIQPQKKYADFVVHFFDDSPADAGVSGKSATGLSVQHLVGADYLHPVLHGDSTLAECAAKAISVRHRAQGAFPFEVHIAGRIAPPQAQSILQKIDIPGQGSLEVPPDLGIYSDIATQCQHVSYPLALTQYILTYYLLRTCRWHTPRAPA
jgi:phosphoribulokinase